MRLSTWSKLPLLSTGFYLPQKKQGWPMRLSSSLWLQIPSVLLTLILARSGTAIVKSTSTSMRPLQGMCRLKLVGVSALDGSFGCVSPCLLGLFIVESGVAFE
jgi:hypothetical protein